MKKEECGCIEHNGIHYRAATKETPDWTKKEIEMCEKFDKLREKEDVKFEELFIDGEDLSLYGMDKKDD